MKRFLAIFTVATMIWACSSDSSGSDTTDDIVDPKPEEVSFERGSMLTNWADNIIIPSHEAFSIEMTGLQTAFDTFKGDASEVNLVAFRASWLSAYKMWQRVSMFEIGPAETVGLRLNMNIYPTDGPKIDGFVSSGTYDLALASNRDAKGFPALDYLINGLGDTDEDIVAKYNGAEKESLISYTGDVIADMAGLTTGVLAEWNSGYRDTFVENDGASSTASVDRFINDYVFYYEKFLRAGKMGIPVGAFSENVLPQNVEAYYKADVSNELFLEGFEAVQDFFNGVHYGKSTSGESLASYLDALNTIKDGDDLTKLINDQFDLAKTKVEALAPFREEIENNVPPTNMLLAYDEVQRIVPMLKVDMVSAMSVSIDFVDADGD
ncbi:imelysin family protein [Zobellia barbeyronii]|uniref:Imelysin family protein n=1 Tax=Zobellia barbeyronii TaxID=2748009 RepID=A0ABS5WG58_9FLAO|nr:imelysin family protein [Zobellia barbeyronii]MBT2162110.1 imelysin family protein [Zobellia barbeyronii]